MNKKVTVLLAGAGGYGGTYYSGITEDGEARGIHIVGIVEPYLEKCPYKEDIEKRGIPVYKKIEDFYSVSKADIAIISTPIQFHCEQVCYALDKGSHVLCEKPVCATVQDAYKMMEARDRSKKTLAIGYQWSYSDTIQNLKKDILSGVYGRAKRLKTAVLWPRTLNYYNRGIGWAGKKKDKDGRWVLDSIAHNATAHYLNNMFYVTGKSMDQSSVPGIVKAELYRANNIDNFDTVAARIFTDDGIEMMYIASHALNQGDSLFFQYEFEKGTVIYEDKAPERERKIIGRLSDGRVIDYGTPTGGSFEKLCCVISHIQGEDSVICTPEAAFSQLLCVNGMQESVPEPVLFPADITHRGRVQNSDAEIIFVEGLQETLINAYQNWMLPTEMGISWARAGKEIELNNYRYYPGGIEG